MLSYIKQKWAEWFVSIVIVVITVLLTQHFTVKNDTKSVIQNQIEQKADKLYVDKQDENIENELKQHARETEKTRQSDLDFMRSIDHKLDILINRK
jgi:hypothetical protein